MLLYASVRRYIFWKIESSATFKRTFQNSLRNDKLYRGVVQSFFSFISIKVTLFTKHFFTEFCKIFLGASMLSMHCNFHWDFLKRFPEVEGGLFTLKPDQWTGKENRKRALSNHRPESCNRSIRIKFFSLLLTNFILYTWTSPEIILSFDLIEPSINFESHIASIILKIFQEFSPFRSTNYFFSNQKIVNIIFIVTNSPRIYTIPWRKFNNFILHNYLIFKCLSLSKSYFLQNFKKGK